MNRVFAHVCRYFIVAFCLFISVAVAQTTVFNYQGRLQDGGTNANGSYDFQFTLWDSLTGGTQQSQPTPITVARSSVAVAGGSFTVPLDFGLSAFRGADRFLEISVRSAGVGNFATLSPRQQITDTPYSLRSKNATAADDAVRLGGVAANQYVVTGDARLSDARNPLPNSANYIQNTSSQQASSNFNISGNGTFGGIFRVEGSGATANTSIGSFSSAGRFDIDAPFTVGGRLAVLNNGNVRYQSASTLRKASRRRKRDLYRQCWHRHYDQSERTPGLPSFRFGKKITLYPGAIGDAGFGVFGNELRIASDNPNADITFGYDDRTNGFTERMRLRSSGVLRLGGSDGVAGQVITSNGSGSAAQWKSPTNALYQGTNMTNDTGSIAPGGTSTPIPGLSQTINVSGNAKLLVQFNVVAFVQSCTFCGASNAYIDVMIDGSRANRVLQDIANGSTNNISGSWLITAGAGSHTVSLNAFGIGPWVPLAFRAVTSQAA